MVKIRFMRIGKKNRPHYRLCAMDSRWPRDGKYIEWLGVYDPLITDDTKKYRINKERAEYWLSVGAQPSETAYSFMKKADVQGLVRITKPGHKRPRRAAKADSEAAARAEDVPAGSAAPKAPKRKPKPPKKQKPPKAEKKDGGAPPA